MAFNLTVEDSSPLVSYAPSGAWTDTPAGDSLIQSYSGSSLHTTSAQGATATINFNGTGIWLFGGKRHNYGTYTISVDGQTTTNGNATSGGPIFNQLLGAASGLHNGAHTVVLTNTGSGTAVDLDSLVFQGQVGPGGSVSNTTIDDSDSRFTYAPSNSDWQVNTQPNLNKNNTLHFTQSQGASATLPFSGNAVAVYGTVSPDHANIRVSLDGKNTTVQGGAGGFARVLHTQTLLYYADNLGPQQHQLVLSADQTSGTSQFMDVDAVTTFSSSGGNNSVGANNAGPSSPNNSKNHPSSHASRHLPVIIGASVGAVVLTLLVALLLFFLHRRRQNKRKSFVNHPITPALPLQHEDMMVWGQRDRDSSHFLDVKLSPGGHPSKSEPMAFPTVSRSGSTRSYSSTKSTTPMIPKATSPLDLPKPPPPTVPRLTSSQNRESGTTGMGAPSRPSRPISLQLSPDSWNLEDG